MHGLMVSDAQTSRLSADHQKECANTSNRRRNGSRSTDPGGCRRLARRGGRHTFGGQGYLNIEIAS